MRNSDPAWLCNIFFSWFNAFGWNGQIRNVMCVAIFSYFHFISIFYFQILLKNDKWDNK